MPGADLTGAEVDPRYCPNCGGTIQSIAKRVKCLNCGQRVRPLEVAWEERVNFDEDTIRQRVKRFVAAVKGEKA